MVAICLARQGAGTSPRDDRTASNAPARRRPGRWFLASLLLGLSATCSAATPAKVIWMTATLDGRKVGYLHYQRSNEPNRVVTRSTLQIRFARTHAHQPLEIRNAIREVESTNGEPLGFSARTDMSAETSSAKGTRSGKDRFRIRVEVGDRARDYLLTWPRDALLNDGVRKAIVAHGFAPGTRYSLLRFDASSQSVTRLQMQVVGPESVELPGGNRQLFHLRETRPGTRSSDVTDLWVDPQGDVLKIAMPLLGFRLELLACSEACAMQPNQDVNILDHAMVMLPRPLPKALRDRPLRFTFRVHPAKESPFISTDVQIVQRFGRNIWIVDTVMPRKGREAPPTAADIAPNDWLQSDAPAIQALAGKAVGKATSTRKRMMLLTQFVRSYIKQEGASVGYASALETLHDRSGDCTEYAVLLAAMARAQKIPARVVTGLVYADRYNGQDYVLIPHTWVQGWVDGVWREYDAALSQYDHTHIAMDVGDGDPWKYFSGISALGSIDLLRVNPGANIGEGRPQFPLPSPGTNPTGGSRNGGGGR